MSERLVAVTGASGFVGRHLCEALADANWQVRALVRRRDTAPVAASEVLAGIDLERAPDWATALRGAHVLVHCAGIAHTAFIDARLARETFDRINREAAIELGRAAVEAGVTRLVFVSSVGVYGPLEPNVSARESMACRPSEPYAVSKLAAERELADVCRGTGTELLVVRPPLVYGPRCPGNFAKLVQLVRTGLPLPLGSLDGRRHFVSVSNLAEFVVLACGYHGEAGGVFNVADAEELDLGSIVRAIGDGLGRPAKVLPCPPALLRAALGIVGKGAIIGKLTESITVDASRARARFGWSPSVSSEVGMRAAAASFVAGERS